MKNPFDEAKKVLEEGYNYSNTELAKNQGTIEAIKQLQEPKNIFGASDYSKDLALKMVKFELMGEILDMKEPDKINQHISNFALSIGRKSREEIIRLAIGMTGSKKKSFGDKVRDLGNPKAGGEE